MATYCSLFLFLFLKQSLSFSIFILKFVETRLPFLFSKLSWWSSSWVQINCINLHTFYCYVIYCSLVLRRGRRVCLFLWWLAYFYACIMSCTFFTYPWWWMSEGLALFCFCVKVECLCWFTEFSLKWVLGSLYFRHSVSASFGIWSGSEFLKACNISLTMENIVL